jgi:hypothetical protein
MQPEAHVFFELVQYFTKDMRRVSDDGLVTRRRIQDQSYFFDRSVRQNDEHFEPFHIRREIRNAVDENAQRLLKNLREKFENIVPFPDFVVNLVPDAKTFTEHLIFDFESPSEYYFHKESSSVIIPFGVSSFCILTKTRKDADDLVKFLKQEFEELNSVTKDFGLELEEVLTGRKYQEHVLRASGNIQNLQMKEPQNEFEKEVIMFCSGITSSLLPNVEISFTEPVETYECDIFMGINETIKQIIEPTDYESMKGKIPQGENLKSQLILRTLDKAQRLGAKSAVITKGFPESAFNDLKKIADSRGIALLNETNYRSSLPRLFCDNLVKAFSEPVRYPVRYSSRFIRTVP